MIANQISDWSIRKKFITILSSGLMVLLVYFLANGIISQNNRSELKEIVDFHLPVYEEAESLGQLINQVRSTVVETALSQSMEGIGELDELNKKVVQEFEVAKGLSDDFVDDFTNVENNYTATYNEMNDLIQNVVAGLEEVSVVQQKIGDYSKSLIERENELRSIKARAEKNLKNGVEKVNFGGTLLLIVGLVILIAAIPFSFFFYSVINQSLLKAGDQLRVAAERVLKISEQANSASVELASRSTEQSEVANKTVSSMSEMKSLMNETLNNSNNAVTISDDSYEEAKNGTVVVEELRDSMEEVEAIYDRLQEVNDMVDLIRNKTDVINDIVFKTQLLSFNASIEAARAGQYGKGFAVVAQEVSKLAELSGSASYEIGQLLEDSAKRIAETIENTKEKVNAANDISQKASQVFTGLNDRSGQVKNMVSSISDSAKEQSIGIQQVGDAMSELNQSAEETKQMARSITDLSESLKAQANTLVVTISNLNGLISGEDLDTEVDLDQDGKFEFEGDDDDFDENSMIA